MALHLARPKQRLHSNPSLIHLFSTSSSSPPQDGNESSEHPSQSPPSPPSDFKIPSYFSGIKSSLKQSQPQDGRRQFVRFDAKAQNPSPPLSGSQISGRVHEMRRNLTDFRSREAAPPPRDWQDAYKQNVLSKKSGDSFGTRKIEGTPWANVKANLRQMKPQANTEGKWASLSGLQTTMKTKFNENIRSNVVTGGGEGLPYSVYAEELEQGNDETEEMKSEFYKSYDPYELGEKLRLYRPEGKKEQGWFSLQELNQRLVKLRAMEEERAQRTSTEPLSIVKELRSEIQKAKAKEAKKSASFQNIDIRGILNGTPKYLLEPPKEQLVKTYFHPDNMSSAEKMKIELAKVREEFKMSESDCGSARVQVAQLTTKIKHLSSVLHKKDKHSRKGLIAMVQRRKKLLKYMRRTDWDSYCLSLSKLGLRDNPDYKC